MGLEIAVTGSGGGSFESIIDPKNLLPPLLPAEGDSAYPLLNSIDLYGDTYFNQIQLGRFLLEWAYVERQARTMEEQELVEAIKRMAIRCSNKSGRFLKFIGD